MPHGSIYIVYTKYIYIPGVTTKKQISASTAIIEADCRRHIGVNATETNVKPREGVCSRAEHLQ